MSDDESSLQDSLSNSKQQQSGGPLLKKKAKDFNLLHIGDLSSSNNTSSLGSSQRTDRKDSTQLKPIDNQILGSKLETKVSSSSITSSKQLQADFKKKKTQTETIEETKDQTFEQIAQKQNVEINLNPEQQNNSQQFKKSDLKKSNQGLKKSDLKKSNQGLKKSDLKKSKDSSQTSDIKKNKKDSKQKKGELNEIKEEKQEDEKQDDQQKEKKQKQTTEKQTDKDKKEVPKEEAQKPQKKPQQQPQQQQEDNQSYQTIFTPFETYFQEYQDSQNQKWTEAGLIDNINDEAILSQPWNLHIKLDKEIEEQIEEDELKMDIDQIQKRYADILYKEYKLNDNKYQFDLDQIRAVLLKTQQNNTKINYNKVSVEDNTSIPNIFTNIFKFIPQELDDDYNSVIDLNDEKVEDNEVLQKEREYLKEQYQQYTSSKAFKQKKKEKKGQANKDQKMPEQFLQSTNQFDKIANLGKGEKEMTKEKQRDKDKDKHKLETIPEKSNLSKINNKNNEEQEQEQKQLTLVQKMRQNQIVKTIINYMYEQEEIPEEFYDEVKQYLDKVPIKEFMNLDQNEFFSNIYENKFLDESNQKIRKKGILSLANQMSKLASLQLYFYGLFVEIKDLSKNQQLMKMKMELSNKTLKHEVQSNLLLVKKTKQYGLFISENVVTINFENISDTSFKFINTENDKVLLEESINNNFFEFGSLQNNFQLIKFNINLDEILLNSYAIFGLQLFPESMELLHLYYNKQHIKKNLRLFKQVINTSNFQQFISQVNQKMNYNNLKLFLNQGLQFPQNFYNEYPQPIQFKQQLVLQKKKLFLNKEILDSLINNKKSYGETFSEIINNYIGSQMYFLEDKFPKSPFNQIIREITKFLNCQDRIFLNDQLFSLKLGSLINWDLKKKSMEYSPIQYSFIMQKLLERILKNKQLDNKAQLLIFQITFNLMLIFDNKYNAKKYLNKIRFTYHYIQIIENIILINYQCCTENELFIMCYNAIVQTFSPQFLQGNSFYIYYNKVIIYLKVLLENHLGKLNQQILLQCVSYESLLFDLFATGFANLLDPITYQKYNDLKQGLYLFLYNKEDQYHTLQQIDRLNITFFNHFDCITIFSTLYYNEEFVSEQLKTNSIINVLSQIIKSSLLNFKQAISNIFQCYKYFVNVQFYYYQNINYKLTIEKELLDRFQNMNIMQCIIQSTNFDFSSLNEIIQNEIENNELLKAKMILIQDFRDLNKDDHLSEIEKRDNQLTLEGPKESQLQYLEDQFIDKDDNANKNKGDEIMKQLEQNKKQQEQKEDTKEKADKKKDKNKIKKKFNQNEPKANIQLKFGVGDEKYAALVESNLLTSQQILEVQASQIMQQMNASYIRKQHNKKNMNLQVETVKEQKESKKERVLNILSKVCKRDKQYLEELVENDKELLEEIKNEYEDEESQSVNDIYFAILKKQKNEKTEKREDFLAKIKINQEKLLINILNNWKKENENGHQQYYQSKLFLQMSTVNNNNNNNNQNGLNANVNQIQAISEEVSQEQKNDLISQNQQDLLSNAGGLQLFAKQQQVLKSQLQNQENEAEQLLQSADQQNNVIDNNNNNIDNEGLEKTVLTIDQAFCKLYGINYYYYSKYKELPNIFDEYGSIYSLTKYQCYQMLKKYFNIPDEKVFIVEEQMRKLLNNRNSFIYLLVLIIFTSSINIDVFITNITKLASSLSQFQLNKKNNDQCVTLQTVKQIVVCLYKFSYMSFYQNNIENYVSQFCSLKSFKVLKAFIKLDYLFLDITKIIVRCIHSLNFYDGEMRFIITDELIQQMKIMMKEYFNGFQSQTEQHIDLQFGLKYQICEKEMFKQIAFCAIKKEKDFDLLFKERQIIIEDDDDYESKIISNTKFEQLLFSIPIISYMNPSLKLKKMNYIGKSMIIQFYKSKQLLEVQVKFVDQNVDSLLQFTQQYVPRFDPKYNSYNFKKRHYHFDMYYIFAFSNFYNFVQIIFAHLIPQMCIQDIHALIQLGKKFVVGKNQQLLPMNALIEQAFEVDKLKIKEKNKLSKDQNYQEENKDCILEVYFV